MQAVVLVRNPDFRGSCRQRKARVNFREPRIRFGVDGGEHAADAVVALARRRMNGTAAEQPSKPENDDSPAPKTLQRTSFESLAQGANEVIIEHQGEEYRLRLTRNGRLILNK